MSSVSDPQAILADPAWLPHRLDIGARNVRFVAVDRPTRHRIPFLIDQHFDSNIPSLVFPFAAACAAANRPAPMAFVLHSAFCCSTLVANALDRTGVASVLKEPVILNDVTGLRARMADPAQATPMLDGAMRLLARPFASDETVIVKPSNVTAALWPTMLALRPDAQGLLLYAPLPTYLASVASKVMWGRLWVRELQWKLMRDGLADFGFSDEEIFRHSDLQVAALGWLAQHRLFASLLGRFGPARLAVLDSETLVSRPAEALTAIARHMKLSIDADEAAATAGGPVFKRHAKTGEAFGAESRAAVHSGPAEANADELEKVEVWAQSVAAHARIHLDLPGRLL